VARQVALHGSCSAMISKVVAAGGTHNLQRTFLSPEISKLSHIGLLNGLDFMQDLLELAILKHVERHVRFDYVFT